MKLCKPQLTLFTGILLQLDTHTMRAFGCRSGGLKQDGSSENRSVSLLGLGTGTMPASLMYASAGTSLSAVPCTQYPFGAIAPVGSVQL